MSNLMVIDERLQIFNSAKTQIVALAQTCNNAVINSVETLESAKNLAKNAKKIETLIEDKRKEITKPILDEKKQIDDYVKNLVKELGDSVSSLRSKILSFEQEQERLRQIEARRLAEERRKAEEAIRIEEENLRKLAETKKSFGVDDLIKINEMKQVAKESENQLIMNSMSASTTIRKQWAYELIDISQLPIGFLMVDDAKVKQALKDGVRNIPGLNIFQKDILNLR